MDAERLAEIRDRLTWPLDEWDIISREDAAIRRRKYFDGAVLDLLAELDRLREDAKNDADMIDILGQQAAEAVRLRGEVERLREALRPLSRGWAACERHPVRIGSWGAVGITSEDLRRAAAALATDTTTAPERLPTPPAASGGVEG